MINAEIKAIFFDYYGTLVNVGRPFDKIKQWFEIKLRSHNANVDIDRFNLNFSKQRAKLLYTGFFMTGMQLLTESYKRTCEKFGVAAYIDEFIWEVTYLFTEPIAFQKTAEIIAKLKQRYKIALITNADNNFLYESIKKNSFDFDFIVSSEDACCNKPGYGIFYHAMSVANLPVNQLLMVGDSIAEDIIPAKELGMDVIWLNMEDKPEHDPGVLSIQNLSELLVTT